MIEIIDNFFSENVIMDIISFFKDTEWFSQCLKSMERNDIDKPYWRKDLNDIPFFNEYMKTLISEKFKKKMSIRRVYATSQTYEQSGKYHVDDNTQNAYTFVLYIIDEKVIDHNDGYFYIKPLNSNKVLSIEPLNNRGILFPSNSRHRGVGFSRLNNNLRICISWKLLLL